MIGTRPDYVLTGFGNLSELPSFAFSTYFSPLSPLGFSFPILFCIPYLPHLCLLRLLPTPITSNQVLAGGTSVHPADSVRRDGSGHLPSCVKIKQRCKQCVHKFTRVICTKCNVELCLLHDKNCYITYHKK